MMMTVSVSHGLLQIPKVAGVNPDVAGWSPRITAFASQDMLTVALNNMTYRGGLNWFGEDQLVIELDDRGNTGFSGDDGLPTIVRTLNIRLDAVPDEPIILEGAGSSVEPPATCAASERGIQLPGYVCIDWLPLLLPRNFAENLDPAVRVVGHVH